MGAGVKKGALLTPNNNPGSNDPQLTAAWPSGESTTQVLDFTQIPA